MARRTNSAKWMQNQKRWQINVQKDGKRRAFYSSTPGKEGQKEANRKADAWLDSGIANDRTRVHDVYPKWLDTIKLTTSKSNWRPLESRWRVWILPGIGRIRIASINEQHLQDVINKGYASGLSRKTLQLMVADMRSFFKFCRKNRVSSFLPEDVKVPKGARQKAKNILQPQDLLRLFNVDTTIMYGKTVFDNYIYAYRFQLLTGLRPGELLGLQWRDIHGKTLHLCRSINQFGEVTTGKNDNAVRSVALSSLARQTLEAQRALTGSDTDVFPISSPPNYLKRWHTYCAANGLPQTSLYEMRHTFVSIAKALPEGQLKDLVGHSADMDTFGIYGHELLGDSDSVADSLDDIFARLLARASYGK